MKGPVYLAVVVTSCVIVMIHMAVIKKFKILWLRNFVMADTLLLGMASSLCGSGYLVNGEKGKEGIIMDKKYETSIHRTGRIGVITAIGFMLGNSCGHIHGLRRMAGEHRTDICSGEADCWQSFCPQTLRGTKLHADPGLLRVLSLF